MMALFDAAGARRFVGIDDEYRFWVRYEAVVLETHGYKGDALKAGEDIVAGWWLKDRVLYPETMEVLDYFKGKGFVMGVISDTFISLPETLASVGILDYFTSVVSSDEAGVMKPDERIYKAALKRAGVSAGEAMYVDDTREEADGARALGMTAFHLKRNGTDAPGIWQINSLRGLVNYMEENLL